MDYDILLHPKPKGIVIYIHDGGFFEGDKSDLRTIKFVNVIHSNGYTVVNANYRLEKYPNPVIDIKNIITYFSKKTDNLIVAGESVGAYLALLSNLMLQYEKNIFANKLILISSLTNLYSNLVTSDMRNLINKFNSKDNNLACPTYYIKHYDLKLKSKVEFIHSKEDFININMIKETVKLIPNSDLHIAKNFVHNNGILDHGISDPDICDMLSSLL